MLLIFDIDGTLVDSTAFDGRLYRKAVRDLFPQVTFRPAWHGYRESTDAGILREIFEAYQIDFDTHHYAVRARFGALVEDHLAREAACRPLPGAAALLSALSSNPGIRTAIATGGWAHTASLKLAAAGISHAGMPMATSDDAESRPEIMKIARRKSGNVPGTPIYVGDATWDLEAAAALGWHFIGVGHKLRGRHDPWIPDFSDPGRFWEILHALAGPAR